MKKTVIGVKKAMANKKTVIDNKTTEFVFEEEDEDGILYPPQEYRDMADVFRHRANDIALILYERYTFCIPCHPGDTIYLIGNNGPEPFVVPSYDWILDNYYTLGFEYFATEEWCRKQIKYIKKHGHYNLKLGFNKGVIM